MNNALAPKPGHWPNLPAKPGCTIEFPDERPVCVFHGCYMKPRRVRRGAKEFYCPVLGCKKTSKRQVQRKGE
jgi:hypothetical protein